VAPSPASASGERRGATQAVRMLVCAGVSPHKSGRVSHKNTKWAPAEAARREADGRRPWAHQRPTGSAAPRCKRGSPPPPPPPARGRHDGSATPADTCGWGGPAKISAILENRLLIDRRQRNDPRHGGAC